MARKPKAASPAPASPPPSTAPSVAVPLNRFAPETMEMIAVYKVAEPIAPVQSA